MKKTSKKKKIIILTAIALIIVIIGILIGTNAIKVNILTGKYNSSNGSSSNGNLLPEYIKSGITLAGVTGTLEDLDTSDATATADDIAWPKTAYVKGKKITGTRGKPIEIDPDTVYYADLTGDGTVDGVIYADLAVGGSGVWNNDLLSNYSYEAETGLKEYYIINEEYTDDFGTGKVIAPKKGTSGKDRFYVMALDDINPGTMYCWYDAAYGKLDKTVATNYNDFGEGRTNTEYVMEKWNDPSLPWGNHNDNRTYLDMWGVIEDKIDAGWFVPSKSEWSAFGDKFKITSSTYRKFGLSVLYWSSSEYDSSHAYRALFSYGGINNYNVSLNDYVRLSTTF